MLLFSGHFKETALILGHNLSVFMHVHVHLFFKQMSIEAIVIIPPHKLLKMIPSGLRPSFCAYSL